MRNGSDEQLGITLYKLRKANEKTPNHPPLQFFLAEVQSKKNLRDEAAKGFQTVVRGDAGRTDITLLALHGLAIQSAEAGDDLKAALCWIAALRSDKANPKTIAKLAEALKKAKLETEAGLVAKLESAAGPSPGRTERAPLAGLPTLAPSAALMKLDGESLYALSAPSVVVIKTREGSGSGVCIGRHDIIVTNAHVVEGSDTVDVNIFAFKDKTLARQAVERGKVVYRSETSDLAIVQLSPTATKLTPMPIALGSPKTGAKIYALGSPGLGREVLEQSISEGIVSSAERKLDGKSYIQHTSAVNPGNSGGPLLDEYGRLVGIVTLKAKLENVGFAIPVETVQGLFPISKK